MNSPIIVQLSYSRAAFFVGKNANLSTMEAAIQGGVDNTQMDNAKLYTQPEDVAYAYEKLNPVSKKFTIAGSFGNVHGAYKAGQVSLTPMILNKSKAHVADKFKLRITR